METIEHIKNKAENIFEEATNYAEARWNLSVLNLSAKLADSISTIAISLVFSFIGLISMLFMSFALAWIIGEYLNSIALGFFAVGLIYILLGIGLFFIRDKFIKIPIINFFIKKFYYED